MAYEQLAILGFLEAWEVLAILAAQVEEVEEYCRWLLHYDYCCGVLLEDPHQDHPHGRLSGKYH